jgi:hypothetical protein
LFVTGCTRQDPRVGSLEEKIVKLEEELASVKTSVRVDSLLRGVDEVAILKPGDDGYSLVKADLGYLTVGMSNIVPYANGSKVTLVFGNLTGATINGLKMKVEWGGVDEAGTPDFLKMKSRETSLSESLLPGAWNKAEIVMEGVPPSQLGFVRVSNLAHRGISLRGRV